MGRHPFVTDPLLLTAITIRDATARNRVTVSSTCGYACVEGGLTDRRPVILGRCTLARAGILFAEMTAVEACGRRTHESAPRCAETGTR